MTHDTIKIKKVNLDNDYNHVDNGRVNNSNFGLINEPDIFFDDSDVYDSDFTTISNVDVLTSLFSGDIQDLGATVKDVSSLKSLVASNYNE